jgi:hypothetical protein
MTDKKKQETKTDNRQPNGWGKRQLSFIRIKTEVEADYE